MGDADQTNISYVLITAAHNEEAYIGTLISSVVSQTLLPSKWVVVSDGSVDATDEIVSRYAAIYPFIELVRVVDAHPRDFASKSHALNMGARRLRAYSYKFIGHLDADISFDSTYVQTLLLRFQMDPSLGISGGVVHEEQGGRFRPRRTNSVRSVAGAVQMFRRECYEAVGGFLPMRFGGEDWHAEITARMSGWRVMSFSDLTVRHHRPTGGCAAWYRQGRMDYCMGCHPLFEMLRIIRRLASRPYVLGSLVRLWAFARGYFRREKRIASPEVVEYLRAEQMGRLAVIRREQSAD
jgi:glycosyltransferase involved in cell wall biosynthesis